MWFCAYLNTFKGGFTKSVLLGNTLFRVFEFSAVKSIYDTLTIESMFTYESSHRKAMLLFNYYGGTSFPKPLNLKNILMPYRYSFEQLK